MIISKNFQLVIFALMLFHLSQTQAGNLSQLFSSGGSTVTFAGYTGVFNGNLGGIKGANQKCAAAHAGSRICLYEDIVRLGANYPYTSEIWWVDGYGSSAANDGGTLTFSKLGLSSMNFGEGTCLQWGQSSGVYYGFSLNTTGISVAQPCATTLKLACCK